MSAPRSYILKNISKCDVNIGDLGVRIPLGQSKDLLDPKLKLNWDLINKSKTEGSIFVRINKRMVVELSNIVPAPRAPTKIDVLRGEDVLRNADRLKSLLIVESGDLSEEIEKMTISDDDEFLKQLDIESMMDSEGNKLVLKDE